MPTTPFHKATRKFSAPDAPDAPDAPEAVPEAAPKATTPPSAAAPTDGLVHTPCGSVFHPGEAGLEFAKRTRTYYCGRCGGVQPAWTFHWGDGTKLVEG